MKKMLIVLGVAGALVASVAAPAVASGPAAISEGARVVVYVESQGLYFDSLVTHELPQRGPFQQLLPGTAPDGGIATEFGPGDKGYVGGRWWVDANGDNEMNDGDAFFSCPLLGQGSATSPA